MDIIISNQTDEPIYAQIVHQITEQIMSGKLKDGQSLPSIRSLATQLHISTITTKRAYDDLEKAGFIFSQVGRGSFVKPQNRELIYEARLCVVEEKLRQAVDAADAISLAGDKLHQMLEIILEESGGRE